MFVNLSEEVIALTAKAANVRVKQLKARAVTKGKFSLNDPDKAAAYREFHQAEEVAEFWNSLAKKAWFDGRGE